MPYIKVDGNQLTLYADDTKKIMQWDAGTLAMDVYNALNARGCASKDMSLTGVGYVTYPGWYKVRRDSTIKKIPRSEFRARVAESDLLGQLLPVMPDDHAALLRIYAQLQSDIIDGIDMRDNGLRYVEVPTDNADAPDLAEVFLTFAPKDGKIDIPDIAALIAYDAQYLQGVHICTNCKCMFTARKGAKFCGAGCNSDFSRHSDYYKGKIKDVSLMLQRKLTKMEQDIDDLMVARGSDTAAKRKEMKEEYGRVYNAVMDWLAWTDGGSQSAAIADYDAAVAQDADTHIMFRDFLLAKYQELLAKQ